MDEMSGKEEPGFLEELTEGLLPGTVVCKDAKLCLFLAAEDTIQ